jgi:hypothetical protein
MELEAKGQVCPWCDTEIVWDPEIGPEEECPHCLNPLGNYSSIVLPIRNGGRSESATQAQSTQTTDHAVRPGQPVEADEELDIFDELDDGFEDSDAAIEAYEEAVELVVNGQEEAPECPSCRQFMLHVGDQQNPPAAKFEPIVPNTVGSALVRQDYSLKMYVCPSCFRVDYWLSEQDRAQIVNRLQAQ